MKVIVHFIHPTEIPLEDFREAFRGAFPTGRMQEFHKPADGPSRQIWVTVLEKDFSRLEWWWKDFLFYRGFSPKGEGDPIEQTQRSVA